MSADELRRKITQVPFQPFTLYVADGRQLPVIDRDFIVVSASGRTVFVHYKDDSYDIVDMLLITGTTHSPPVHSSAPAANP